VSSSIPLTTIIKYKCQSLLTFYLNRYNSIDVCYTLIFGKDKEKQGRDKCVVDGIEWRIKEAKK